MCSQVVLHSLNEVPIVFFLLILFFTPMSESENEQKLASELKSRILETQERNKY